MEGLDPGGGDDFEIKLGIVQVEKKIRGKSSPYTSEYWAANFF
jgi:hypothetical protein